MGLGYTTQKRVKGGGCRAFGLYGFRLLRCLGVQGSGFKVQGVGFVFMVRG